MEKKTEEMGNQENETKTKETTVVERKVCREPGGRGV